MSKRENLVRQLSETLGISLEEAEKAVPAESVKEKKQPAPVQKESPEELLMEAQAALNYFLHRGTAFYREVCRNCNQKFRYAWYYAGIKTCSIECMSQLLAKIGIDWTPNRPLDQRWGLKAAPAVVPPQALQVIDSLLEAHLQDPLPGLDSLNGTSLPPENSDNSVDSHPEEFDQFLEDLDQLLEK